MLLADDEGREHARGRIERIDRRIDALFGDRARQHRRRVEMGEGGRRRRIGQVVGRHIDRLHRGDRAFGRRGDALLQGAHVGRQRRLIADRRGNAAEQRRHFRARLREAEDVVDEEQHVLAPCRGNPRRRVRPVRRDARARARRLVHLAIDQRAFRSRGRAAMSRGFMIHLAIRSSRDRDRCLRACARRRRRRRNSRHAPWRRC